MVEKTFLKDFIYLLKMQFDPWNGPEKHRKVSMRALN